MIGFNFFAYKGLDGCFDMFSFRVSRGAGVNLNLITEVFLYVFIIPPPPLTLKAFNYNLKTGSEYVLTESRAIVSPWVNDSLLGVSYNNFKKRKA